MTSGDSHHDGSSSAHVYVDGEVRPAVRCVGLTKHYGATRALEGVDIVIPPATVWAFVGENGAGKSTCLSLIAGRVKPTAGKVEVFGQEFTYGDPRASRAAGITAIYQELTIVPELTAEANVFLGAGTIPHRYGLLSSEIRTRYIAMCESLGVRSYPGVLAGSLSVADQQLLEIMRALTSDARVVLFDEPTAALAATEKKVLHRIVRDLKSRGIAVALVSHDLDEVLELADYATVFRDGSVVAEAPASDWSKESLITSMLGHRLVRSGGRGTRETRVVAEVRDLDIGKKLRSINLDIRAGEILGIGGLVGSGRTTLLRSLAGLIRESDGELNLDGERVRWPRNVRQARHLGFGYLPEDRKVEGLALRLPADDNVVMTTLGAVSRWGVVSPKKLRATAGAAAEPFGFKRKKLNDLAGDLSGGNQQKLLLARMRLQTPRILLADEPTRGIDIGAKEEIVKTLRLWADEGLAVVVVSSDTEELVAISDRIAVLRNGVISRVLDSQLGEVTTYNALQWAFEVEQ